MGGFFGITSKEDCLNEVFFGVDYHSHLGTKTGGIAAYDKEIGLQREIHKINNSPFRTKFEHVFEDMQGTAAIGCINDGDPQPLLVRTGLGVFAICMIGVINNAQALIDKHMFEVGGHYEAMTGGKINSTELVAALINQKKSFEEGIRYAQELIDGTASILILKEDGNLIAARDLYGRLPVLVGKGPMGHAVSFESFAYQKFGFEDEKELGPGEIVEITPDSITQLMEPGKKKKICAFLWSYYGYPTSTYEGVNVEIMRYRNGAIMARHDAEVKNAEDVDYVGGVP
ncbi:MAG: amidophosphoribosyltransferase, partial [Lachnospiraceae bacterium]|nr:amidophosphoribosyltransferase [Lachnospiraceae bacterium]